MEAATGVATAAAMAAFVESLISLQVLKRLLSLLVFLHNYLTTFVLKRNLVPLIHAVRGPFSHM